MLTTPRWRGSFASLTGRSFSRGGKELWFVTETETCNSHNLVSSANIGHERLFWECIQIASATEYYLTRATRPSVGKRWNCKAS
jgi:hypothetical protein